MIDVVHFIYNIVFFIYLHYVFSDIFYKLMYIF